MDIIILFPHEPKILNINYQIPFKIGKKKAKSLFEQFL